MAKVLVYDIAADKAKHRNFNSDREAEHYASELKRVAFCSDRRDVPAVFIEVIPS